MSLSPGKKFQTEDRNVGVINIEVFLRAVILAEKPQGMEPRSILAILRGQGDEKDIEEEQPEKQKEN